MILVLKMVFNFARKSARSSPALLSELKVGETGVLGEFNLPERVADQLMNLGFIPGLEVTVAGSGPGGDPRIYRVDGTEVALRRELARHVAVRGLKIAHGTKVEATSKDAPHSTGASKTKKKVKKTKMRADGRTLVLAVEAQEASAD
jgi:ferrous iron transport protein A